MSNESDVNISGDGSGDHAEVLGALSDDSIGGLFSFVKKAAKYAVAPVAFVHKAAWDAAPKAWRDTAKKVVHSGVTKSVVGGVAIAFPPVGVPAAAGLVIADKALQVAEGIQGTPAQQEAMKRTITNTVAAAAKGDQDADRAVHAMALARHLRAVKASKEPSGARVSAPLVHPDGRIEHGVWVKV
jgi:hypothetical protein